MVAAPLILLGVACQLKPTFQPGTYMDRLQKRGRIVIGVKYDIPRFGLLNPKTNEVTGFDVDLGKEIAKRLRVRAEFVEAVSPDRIPLLQNDEVDLVISTMTINEERRAQIDFSDVYYVAQQRLLVRRDSKIQGVKSLEAEKAPVCSGEKSTSAQNIAAVAPHAPLRLEKKYSTCARLVREGEVEALFTDDVILTGLLSQDPGRFKIVGDPVTVEHYGIGIKKGRPEFVEFVNEVIGDVKDDGTWGMLYANWIGQVTGEKVDPPPAEPVSGPGVGRPL
ncbi:MAG: glutamate ABC transporter substrate-binding protein [Actinomycetota bacterium]